MRPLSLARRKETHLKYAVEVKIPRSTPMMGLLEPILERVVYEDIPFNLAALKQRVEDIKLQRRIAELEEQGLPQAAPLCIDCDIFVVANDQRSAFLLRSSAAVLQAASGSLLCWR